MTTHTAQRALILDDGDYYVELNENFPAAIAPGFLQRRCYVGVTTPGGYECIGSFERQAGGVWRASVDSLYDPSTDSDSRSVGEYAGRLDVIVALWSARRDALCRHRGE